MRGISPILGVMVIVAVVVGAGSLAFAISNQQINTFAQKSDIQIIESSIIKSGVVGYDRQYLKIIDDQVCFVKIKLLNSGTVDFSDLAITTINGTGTEIEFVFDQSLLKEFSSNQMIELINPPYIDPDNPTNPPIDTESGDYCKAWKVHCDKYPLTVYGMTDRSTVTAIDTLGCDRGTGA